MKKQNGNALWFILIAVALIGILTAALTRGGSSTDDTGSYEKNQLAASEILRYASSIESAVQSLLARGCSENDISFWHDSDGNGTENGSDDYFNANSPTDHSCHVFEPEGAGLTWQLPPARINDGSDYFFNSGACIRGVGPDVPFCNGSDGNRNEELLIALPNISLNNCIALNRLLGVTNPSGVPPQDPNCSITTSTGLFQGTFNNSGCAINDTATSDGLHSGCMEGGTDPPAGTYHFYHVLHAR